MSELLHCPFCGAAVSVENLPWIDGESAWSVEHNDLGAAVAAKCPMVKCTAGTEAEIVKAWNTRVERTCRLFKRSYFGFGDGIEFGIWECSECGKNIEPRYGWNYCPNCGAKVIGGNHA